MVKVHKKKLKIKSFPIKLTRKEIRKQKKIEKKENKRLFFSNNEPEIARKILLVNGKQQRDNKKQAKTKAAESLAMKANFERVDLPTDEILNSDFSNGEAHSRWSHVAKQSQDEKDLHRKKPKASTVGRLDIEEQHRRELKRKSNLESEARKRRIKQLKLENEEEDKLITKLEKKLKLNKTKCKKRLVRKIFSDGLDFALELCFDDEDEQSKKPRASQDTNKSKLFTERSWSDEEQDEERFNTTFGNADDVGSERYNNCVGNEAEESDSCCDIYTCKDEEELEEKHQEDIYGRKRDKDGNIIKDLQQNARKYIPPHQRGTTSAKIDKKESELLDGLHRQCKGLLNRLSETNLYKISVAFEKLYMNNSRSHMNETLNKLLQSVLIGRVLSNERLVQEHMVLLAYLHAHIGSEVGAYFLQIFIEKFDQLLKESDDFSIEDKRLNNILLILSYMYVLKIFEYNLFLQIIERLSGQLSEKTIECLLLIFQSVGFKLRKDDPSAFKQMMLDVRSKISAAPLELKENLRLKFMVDILNAVKNNNVRKIPKFDPEMHENLRKKLKAMLRNDKYVTTLNIALDDLLKANSVGKWWIVGSAWSNDINEISNVEKSKANDMRKDSNGKERFSEKLLALAKQQKMNTEERRNIFCIIMSADDCMDAFEILRLSIKDQRSIAYVIIHCCLNEKSSNPYYAHLALKFCLYDRKYQLAFQFASWDRISDIDALNTAQLRNLAQFLQHLILHGGLQLSTLKVIDFLQLNKRNFVLMRDICKHLLLTKDEQKLYQSFEVLAKNDKLRHFKQNMSLFLHHFLLKEQGNTLKLSDEQFDLMKQRIEYIDKLLVYVDL
ncbi:nucleolar MIF4G domain-containing protein 1 homolog [Glossina fuscipes]|uniref:Nucleolar MIF4G domain-containing protein 1 homolog n=1 Tax=Glossina fuscipes TaxID=7396 RepID=A0A8U0W4D3_9MUSC|nr:nucleolar MIF4G domain-containing protein 1 homolog [Glossina fuscipes]KAI9586716.1 hypothetical protein GQX74_002563 [Glossina fuscipes]